MKSRRSSARFAPPRVEHRFWLNFNDAKIGMKERGEMDRSQEKPAYHRADRTIPRLVLAGFCVILLTLGAGSLLYRNILRLIEAHTWYEHSLEVQANLQSVLLRLDRIDSLAHLYLATRGGSALRDAQNMSLTVKSNAHQIADLVTDNPAQLENARELNIGADRLAESLETLDAPNAVFPAALQLKCRESAVLMLQQERTLLQRRAKESSNSTTALTFVGLLLASFCILVVIMLFGVLIRDALFRRKAEEQAGQANEQLASTIQVLEDRAAEMELLGHARDQLQMCVQVKEAYDVSVHFVSQLLPHSSGSLNMIDNSRQMIELCSSWGEKTNTLEAFPMDVCCGMRSGHIRWRTPENSVLHCEHFDGPPPERYICLPMVAHGDTMGMLYVECPTTEAALTVEHHLNPLRDLLQLASMTVAAINLRSKLESQSIRDSLTGLFNRHFMEITLDREIRRAQRHQTSLAVFMIDADNFKQFNDTFGHKAGDTVLRAIADRFLSSVRSEDIVCRYGGEEFIIILPDISAQKAAERAQQIREAISSLRVMEYGQTLGAVTVSIGVAMYPQDGKIISELLQASDRSLYAAKNSGRNKVVFAASAAGTAIAAKQAAAQERAATIATTR